MSKETDLIAGLRQLLKDYDSAPATQAVAPPVPAGGVKPLGLDGPWALTFEDQFRSLDWSKWDSIFNHSDPTESGCSLLGNGELQWYPNHRQPIGSPWRASIDGLVIEARKLTEKERTFVGYNRPGLQTIGQHQYLSGLLSSHRSFAQQYGFFETRCKMPAGHGLWPAFWAKAQSGDWPPELDFFEVLGHEPNRLYVTEHFKEPDHKSLHVEAWLDTTAWHTYGWEWNKDVIVLYVDGKVAGGGPLPNKINEPMHLLLNLAVGGSWGGNPDASTVFPARLEVDYVRAWRLT